MQVGDLVKEKRRPLFETKDKYAIVIAVYKPRRHGSNRRIEVLYGDSSTAVRSEIYLEVVCN